MISTIGNGIFFKQTWGLVSQSLSLFMRRAVKQYHARTQRPSYLSAFLSFCPILKGSIKTKRFQCDSSMFRHNHNVICHFDR